MNVRHHRLWLAAATATALVLTGAVAVPAATAQPAGCRVTYTVATQWSGGFTAEVTIDNLGAPVTGWQLTWSFPAGQAVDQLWNGSHTQSGAQVTVTNAGWNGAIATGGSASFGFNGTWDNVSNPVPDSFVLNGVSCTGQPPGPPPPPAPPQPPPAPQPPPPPPNALPSSFQWSSSGIVAGPKADSRNLAAIKDPTVVFHDGRYHVFASTAKAEGYNLVYFNVADWSQANSATHHYLDQSAIGTGYRAAPQVFYFAPQGLWYLVYQTGNASYSTNPDISDPNGWSAPRHFYSSMPPIIQQNIGDGFWVDMWVICDTVNCYLFSSDDNGHLYRSQTSLSNFPNGMSQPVIALQDANRFALFEAANVYRVQGSDRYLLLVEAIGSDGRRWFRSWTATAINGTWIPLAASEGSPFARSNNVSFNGTPWTQDISHGELIRAGNDQTLTISPCQMRYLYQGMDPSAGGEYNSLPWRLGLLTQTNSTC